MQMTGEYRIPAPRDIVWQGLNDPEILKQCIPGAESVDKVSDTEFTARVSLAVGPVKAKFNGKVTLSDLDPPNGYKITGEGQGGVAGFGKGGADVRLEAEDDSVTVLRYSAQATVGGKLAQVGARLIDGTAKKLADEFFSRFAQTMSQEAAPAAAAEPQLAPVPEAVEAATPAAAPPAVETPAPARLALRPIIWIPALILVIAILLWLVT